MSIRPQSLEYLPNRQNSFTLQKRCITILKKFFCLGVIIWEPTRWQDFCGSKIQPSFPRPLCWNLSVKHHTCQTTLLIISFKLDESKMNFNFTAGFSNCSNHCETCPAQQLAILCKHVETWKIPMKDSYKFSFQIILVYIHMSRFHEDAIGTLNLSTTWDPSSKSKKTFFRRTSIHGK